MDTTDETFVLRKENESLKKEIQELRLAASLVNGCHSCAGTKYHKCVCGMYVCGHCRILHDKKCHRISLNKN